MSGAKFGGNPHTNPTRERGRQAKADPLARASGWCGSCAIRALTALEGAIPARRDLIYDSVVD